MHDEFILLIIDILFSILSWIDRIGLHFFIYLILVIIRQN